MPKFRKKPIVIEARQMPERAPVPDDLKQWCGGWTTGIAGERIGILTLEGTMYASPKDWIIEGVQGEFYPCREDIFEETYEQVAE